jgi:hypothetical protein
MNVCALINRHQCLTPHSRPEVRHDDGNGGKARGDGGNRERIAQPKIEGRWQAELLANSNGQHATMREYRRLVFRCRRKDLSDPLIVQSIGVHRGKQTYDLQP